MTQNNPKGSGFLKVTGILLIIFGAIALILSIISLLGVSVFLSAAKEAVGAEEVNLGVSSFMLYVGSIFLLISSAAELVTGIIGCVNCKRPEKANVCLAWGIIVAVLCVLSSVITVIGGGKFNVISLLFGLVLPVLFIIGAVRNRQ